MQRAGVATGDLEALIRSNRKRAKLVNHSLVNADESDRKFIDRLRNRMKGTEALQDTHMSALHRLIKLKALDLGYTYDSMCGPSSPSKMNYPCLYVNDQAKDIELPLSGTARVKFKLRSKTTRQNEEGKQKHSADIEIHSIEPIEDEAAKTLKEGEKAKLLSSIQTVDDLVQFVIKINPKNKGKLTETKKRTGKGSQTLLHSRNSLTRKRANFAIQAKKWGRNRKEKHLSARSTVIRFSGLGAVEGQGTKGIKSVLAEIMRKNKPRGAGTVVQRVIKKAETKPFSAKLSELFELAMDPRPRNALGEFNGGEQGGPSPDQIGTVYKTGSRLAENVAGGAAAGLGAAVSGSAVKDLLRKVKRARK